MSTRAVIARPTPTTDDPDEFQGVYHHFDGYPTGLGRYLYDLCRGHFAGDAAAMLRTLIDQHPAGWSSIDGDFSQKPGYIELYGTLAASKIDTERRDLMDHHLDKIREAFDGPDRRYSPDDLPTVGQEAQQSAILYLNAHPRYRVANRPRCYCHGHRHEEASPYTYDSVLDSDIEYVYVIDAERKTMRVSVPGYDTLAFLASVDLTDHEEPDWAAMEEAGSKLADSFYEAQKQRA